MILPVSSHDDNAVAVRWLAGSFKIIFSAVVQRCGLNGGAKSVPAGAVSGSAQDVEAIHGVPKRAASWSGKPYPSYQLG